MFKLTLVIFSLSSGGAERIMSILANYWAARGWQVTLITFVDKSQTPFYALDDRINYRSLDIAGNSTNFFDAIANNVRRILRLRKAIANSEPDVVISFIDQANVQTLLATKGLHIPTIVSERTVTLDSTLGKTWKQIRKWTYLLADALVMQTERSLDYIPARWKSLTRIIPNPVILPPVSIDGDRQLLKPNSVLAMGRLEYQKGFDVLLQAFARLKDSYPQWTLTVLGEGSLRSELEKLRDSLGLKDRVFLIGRQQNSYQYLKQAEIFVLSSRYEGFPNALCEAMACGLPVIATDCPCGPRELIRDENDGILIPPENITALAEAMEHLMKDGSARKRLGINAAKVTERFDLEVIMSLWEKTIKEVVRK
jgi:glycosyltransferase involved in cell wall biosynthesis